MTFRYRRQFHSYMHISGCLISEKPQKMRVVEESLGVSRTRVQSPKQTTIDGCILCLTPTSSPEKCYSPSYQSLVDCKTNKTTTVNDLWNSLCDPDRENKETFNKTLSTTTGKSCNQNQKKSDHVEVEDSSFLEIALGNLAQLVVATIQYNSTCLSTSSSNSLHTTTKETLFNSCNFAVAGSKAMEPNVDSITHHMLWLFHVLQIEPPCVVALTIYLQRIISMSTSKYVGMHYHSARFRITTRNFEPLLVAALLLATKFWDDLSTINCDFHRALPQYPLAKLNKLECLFLGCINWKLNVTKVQYKIAELTLNSMEFETSLKKLLAQKAVNRWQNRHKKPSVSLNTIEMEGKIGQVIADKINSGHDRKTRIRSTHHRQRSSNRRICSKAINTLPGLATTKQQQQHEVSRKSVQKEQKHINDLLSCAIHVSGNQIGKKEDDDIKCTDPKVYRPKNSLHSRRRVSNYRNARGRRKYRLKSAPPMLAVVGLCSTSLHNSEEQLMMI